MSNAVFSAHCLTVHNPFNPAIGREHKVLNEPLCIHQIAPVTDRPFIVIKNGDYVLRKDWGQVISDGDNLAVVMLPLGGNDGGSDVGRVILTIIVLIVSYYVPFVGLEMTGWQASSLAAGISIAGSASININLEAKQ